MLLFILLLLSCYMDIRYFLVLIVVVHNEHLLSLFTIIALEVDLVVI